MKVKIGTFVWLSSGRLLRFGVLREVEKKENGWTYGRVDWLEDDKYKNLRREANIKEQVWYRLTNLEPVNPQKLLDTFTAWENQAVT